MDGAWAQGSGGGTASPESKGSNREREIKDFERLIEQANRLVEKEKIRSSLVGLPITREKAMKRLIVAARSIDHVENFSVLTIAHMNFDFRCCASLAIES